MIQIKNAAELEKMRKACAISAAALKAGGEAIEPGITTAEIDKIIYDFIVRHGARPNFLHLYGFPATACISVNDTVIHGIPNHQQQIRPGDIVSIDTGCKIDGFNGDNACTYGCGKLDLEAQRLLDVTKESLHRGIAMACGGNRIGDISHAVQAYVEENGFSVVRSFVGHGVGKELHEDPEVPNYGNAGRGPRLVPGMCIAIEPMVCQYKYAVKPLIPLVPSMMVLSPSNANAVVGNSPATRQMTSSKLSSLLFGFMVCPPVLFSDFYCKTEKGASHPFSNGHNTP